jgi:hypothetical protein
MNFEYKVREFNEATGDIVVEYDHNTTALSFNLVKTLTEANKTFVPADIHWAIVAHYPLTIAIARQAQASMTPAEKSLATALVGVSVDITAEITRQLQTGVIDIMVV